MYENHTKPVSKPYRESGMSNADLLSLTQWLSPAFPVGGYAYSHGLETAISDGSVTDSETLSAWLEAILSWGSGRADAVLLAAAMDPQTDVNALAETARALSASRERWVETIEQGSAFVKASNALREKDDPAMPLPVAVGYSARSLALPPAQVTALYLHAFTSNLVSAAVRFVPLGQTEGQKVLAALHGVIETVASEAVTLSPDDITSSVFGADLQAMAHETQTVRIFKT